MADVTPVHGPIGPQDPTGKKEKKAENPEKFQEEMKIQKVREIDPEQSKKRKRREEQEDEEVEEKPEPPAPTSNQNLEASPYEVQAAGTKRPPPTLGEAPSDPIPYAKTSVVSYSESEQAGGALQNEDDSFTQSLPPPPTAAPSSGGGDQPPPQDMAQGQPSPPPSQTPDMGGFEEPGFPAMPGEQAQTSQPQPSQQPSQTGQATQPQTTQGTQTTPSESSQDKQESQSSPGKKTPPVILPGTPLKKEDKAPPLKGSKAPPKPETPEPTKPSPQKPPSVRGEPTPSSSTPKEETRPAPAASQPSAPPVKPEGGTATPSTPTGLPTPPGPQESLAQKEGFFETFAKAEPAKEEKPAPAKTTKKEGKEEEEVAASGVGVPVLPAEKSESMQQEKHDTKHHDESISSQSGLPGTEAAPLLSGPVEGPLAPPPSAPAFTRLHPQILDLFERMTGVITVVQMQGKSETTIHLTSPQFASSVFFGSQIIIEEFSTAPKAYNVQLLGTAQAIKTFDENVEVLLNSFQTGNYNFKINRIETGLTPSEKPLFSRKEKISGEEKGQQEGEQQQ
jgi:hypothetical protein